MRVINVLFFVLALICSAKAQDKSNDTTARYFVIQASIANLQEVAIGRLAADRATNPDVKAFAARMVTDHSKTEAQLMQLIKAKGLQIPPAATDPPVEDMMLKNTPDKDFDRIYVHMMVPDHRQAIQLFESYAITGKDPDVKAFARQILPTLKEHLAAIVAIDNKMSNSASD